MKQKKKKSFNIFYRYSCFFKQNTATLDPFFPLPPFDIVEILLIIETIPPLSPIMTGTYLVVIFKTGIYLEKKLKNKIKKS